MDGIEPEGKGKTVEAALFGEPAGFVTEVAELEIHGFSQTVQKCIKMFFQAKKVYSTTVYCF